MLHLQKTLKHLTNIILLVVLFFSTLTPKMGAKAIPAVQAEQVEMLAANPQPADSFQDSLFKPVLAVSNFGDYLHL